MDRGTVARIEDWEEHPFSGSFAGLQELADAEFTGAVRSGGTWLFVLNGRIVGVADGTVEAFESDGGTAFEAPHPSLPLLFAMQDRGGETKARYFTDDTPLEEVHETLSAGSFTGYIELAENVHSGDYYVVYYGGRALTVAFVGGTGRLLTDDEAFEQATDEVGIFEVRDVDLEVQDVPEPEESAATGAAVAPTDGDASDGTESDESPRPSNSDATEAASKSQPAETEADETPPVENTTAEAAESTRPESVETDPNGATAESPQSTETERQDQSEPESAEERSGETDESTGRQGVRTPEGEDPIREEQAWRETRAVPALDPDESGTAAQERRREAAQERTRQADRTEPEANAATEQSTAEPTTEQAEANTESSAPDEQLAELKAELSELRNRLETVEAERDQLREERETLERELEDAREEDGSAGPDAEADETTRALDAETALDQTDLLVRFGSKSDATLADAHDDATVSSEEVGANLRLETHTRFDADAVTIDGTPYESFVEETLEYRFAAWVARALLFEIRDTGNDAELSDLYDAIPAVDRVEFGGTVSMRDDEGDERRESFDVVFRNQMGEPIAVANLNDDRDPATGDMMADLLESSNAVAERQDALAAAFSVTASFFAPEALETAEEATTGGLLNRDSRRSFVNTSRKRGYHLCLVEAHGDEFRLAVPDL